MATTLEDFGIDLFGSEDLSLGELRKLDTLVNSSEISKIAFGEQIEANSKKKPITSLSGSNPENLSMD